MGEKSNKGDVVYKGVMRRFTKASVNNKGDLLKSKKADAQRQQDIFHGKTGMEYRIDVFKEKIVIFEVK